MSVIRNYQNFRNRTIPSISNIEDYQNCLAERGMRYLFSGEIIKDATKFFRKKLSKLEK